MTHRPCGACRALIPLDSGCPHWRPRRGTGTTKVRVRTREEMDRSNEQRRKRRAQQRAEAPPRPRRQLASDAERVAEFARIMGRNYR